MYRIYWIPKLHYGSLGMMARPRGNDWLEDEIRHLRMQGVDVVVSLLERDEVYELGLQKEADFCHQKEIEFISFPLPDRGLPEDERGFMRLAKTLSEGLEKGQRITIHCRMGIGRTSLLCATIMVLQGANPTTIFEHLSTVRTLEVPDTEDQKAWFMKPDRD